uniref:hypothetical protein n=1 Tax=Marinobacter shengliensis TaxID=1389223 RepID=UPI001BB2C5B9
TGSSFKGPVPGIPEQGEIQTGNLVPLWRAAYGTQPTRISEEPCPYSYNKKHPKTPKFLRLNLHGPARFSQCISVGICFSMGKIRPTGFNVQKRA